VTTPAVERDALLPRTARDQRELAAAVEDLREAGARAAERAILWSAVGIAALLVVWVTLRRLA
jgi:hypothetical protein